MFKLMCGPMVGAVAGALLAVLIVSVLRMPTHVADPLTLAMTGLGIALGVFIVCSRQRPKKPPLSSDSGIVRPPPPV